MSFRPLQIPKRPLQPIRLARGVCLKLNFSPLLASAYKGGFELPRAKKNVQPNFRFVFWKAQLGW